MAPATTEMPQPIPTVPCQCLASGYIDDDTGCICGISERVLRAGGLFTPEQREWCLCEIAGVEGHRREDHEGDADAELGRAVLDAWVDYCRDKGML